MVKQEAVAPKAIVAIDQVRLRKFYPVDRESPIFEVMLDDQVIFDVARTVDTDPSSEFEIAIHQGAAGVRITLGALNDILYAAKKLITEGEADS